MVVRDVALPVIIALLRHGDGQMVERHYGHLAPSSVPDPIRSALGSTDLVEPDNVTVIASKA